MSTAGGNPDKQGRIVFADYREGCPAVDLLGLIGNRWVSLAVYALGQHEEPLRYGEIGRALPGVTKKMLTESLRTLERNDMVTRTVTGTAPSRVDYELTPLGRSLHDLLITVRTWAELHIQEPAPATGTAG